MAEPRMPEMPPVQPGPEQAEQQEGKAKEQVAEIKKDPVMSTQTPAPSIPVSSSTTLPEPEVVKNETLQEIEEIMQDDLEEVYSSLPPEKKAEFKKVGEETAAEIEGMLYHVKVKSKKVFKLLFSWLKIIPGVSKYFLQQEAKTKTDEIMHLKDKIDHSKDSQV